MQRVGEAVSPFLYYFSAAVALQGYPLPELEIQATVPRLPRDEAIGLGTGAHLYMSGWSMDEDGGLFTHLAPFRVQEDEALLSWCDTRVSNVFSPPVKAGAVGK